MATTKDNGQNGYSLPDGWEWSTLEDCVDILDGRRVPINSEERERRITGKDQSELFPYYGATGHVGWIDDFIFDEEIVLLGEDGAPFLEATKNKAYIVRGKSWVNNHAHVLRAKAGITTNLFLMHYLNIFDYHDYVTGTTRLKLNQGRMRVFPIPLPPLPEQERIVSRIEELFSDLEAGVAALERVRAGLRRYKASVLKAACEGMLLKDEGGWVKDESKLPEGWKWVTLEELSSDANYGTSQKCDYNENEFPVVRIPNIISGNIELSDLKFAIDGSGLRDKDSLAPGDLLIVRTNGSRDLIGKSALIRRPLEKQLYFASYLIRYRIADYENVGSWIATIWDSPFIRAWIETVVSTTAGQYNLNIAKLNKLPIPLPPLDEQQRIVAEVERRLSVVGEVESAVEAGLARAAKLRQAILKHAFEGKL
ncbi:MAG: restriction endonuclease subunit S [Anaerolineales bacterium]|nr:restriction endonuclease subunit S [Anaerolineales bacterium]